MHPVDPSFANKVFQYEITSTAVNATLAEPKTLSATLTCKCACYYMLLPGAELSCPLQNA